MANLKDLIVNGSARILGTLYAPDMRNTNRITEFIVGTQTTTTGSWTGVTKDDSLYDGKSIHYFLPYAGSGNASLNLTLSNGTTTGAKPVYRWGTSYVTTHYPVNSCINMTYNATKGAWFVDADYDVNDWTNKVCWNNNIYAVTAITAGKLICGTKDGYKHVESGITFDIAYPLLYAGSNINASANGTNNFLIFPGVNLQNTKASWTGTQKSMVFLVGTLSGSTFTIDSSIFTTTVPSSEDGKVYMPIGILYSTYQIYFSPSSDLYAYFNGSFQPLQPDVDIDNTTITKNASSKLQTVAVKDNRSGNAIKTWTGTKAQYDAITTKDANTLYNITDDTSNSSIVADLNNKCDVDGNNATFAHIVETYVNGTSWYRVYSDGWCEQGGYASSGTNSVTLLKPYANTNYNIQISSTCNGTTYSTNPTNRTTTSFNFVYNGSAVQIWQAKGYIN